MKTDYNKISNICDIAIYRGLIEPKRRASLLMDLECACQTFDLDLDKLLAFDKLSFAHDISEIRWNINRKTRKFNNCFVPRSAGGAQ